MSEYPKVAVRNATIAFFGDVIETTPLPREMEIKREGGFLKARALVQEVKKVGQHYPVT